MVGSGRTLERAVQAPKSFNRRESAAGLLVTGLHSETHSLLGPQIPSQSYTPQHQPHSLCYGILAHCGAVVLWLLANRPVTFSPFFFWSQMTGKEPFAPKPLPPLSCAMAPTSRPPGSGTIARIRPMAKSNPAVEKRDFQSLHENRVRQVLSLVLVRQRRAHCRDPTGRGINRRQAMLRNEPGTFVDEGSDPLLCCPARLPSSHHNFTACVDVKKSACLSAPFKSTNLPGRV